MSERTGIAWTDHTFNPWWGCVKVSPGCQHCYAETLSERYGHDVWGPAKTTDRRVFGEAHWGDPRKWNAAAANAGVRRRVFSGSMCDVFEDHPALEGEREKLWALIRQTPFLDWQLLTKRPENIMRMLPADWSATDYSNVWLGTSVEDQERAEERIPELLKVPAWTHFLSCEPLLGPVDLRPFLPDEQIGGVEMETWPDWVIVGGESGAQRRPMEMPWLASIVRDCRQAGVAVFVKQDGAFKPDQRGRIPDELWVREFPGPVTVTLTGTLPTGRASSVEEKA